MTVEDQRRNLLGEDVSRDRFPVGMRVLAVDDDPICLKLLDTLLQRCHYQGLLPFLFLLFLV
jgi:two-component response regulator (ARR-B family)